MGRYAYHRLRSPVRFHALLATALAAVAAFVSCTSSTEPPPPYDAGAADGGAAGFSGEVSCAEDERVDTYTAGLTKQGEHGVLSFRLAASDPAPPAKGGNTFQVFVQDGEGTPLGGDLRIDLRMPDHGHGTQVTPVVSYDDASSQFAIAPVYLFMAGVWRVELELYEDADASAPLDSAAFFFCIEG